MPCALRMLGPPLTLLLVSAPEVWADPDPVALLRGVEAAREPLRGKLSVAMTSEGIRPKTAQPRRISLEFVFDREKRRYIHDEERVLALRPPKRGERPTPGERFEAMGQDSERAVALGLGRWEPRRTRVAYDGAQVFEYSEKAGAAIKDPKDGSSVFCLDPRIIGLTRVTTVGRTLDASLGFRTAKAVRLAGREVIRGQPVWHVVVVRPVPHIEYHFWVEDREGYRVHRFQYREEPPPPEPATLHLAELYYDGGSPYPSRVEEHKVEPNIEYKVIFDIKAADLQFKPDRSLFGLAGLEMPPGERVSDRRIGRAAGYWDGEGLTKDRSKAVKQAAALAEAQHRGRGRTVTIILVVAALGLLVFAVWFFRRGRARAVA